jgi:stearoyl-CoA desaturase (Delta-9 desaturase)
VQTSAASPAKQDKIGLNTIPFWFVHAVCLLGIWIHPTLESLIVCAVLYFARMFGITAGYHRYFAHRTFKTNRVFQFILAWLGTSSMQKGVLWWAGHHRHHHRYSDQPEDLHSPAQRGFWWSHMFWFLAPKYDETPFDKIQDFAKYPELRWVNKYHLVPPILLGFAVWALFGWSGLIWGFFVSTVLCWHGTFTINSLSHVFGKQRYRTTDTSRNNWILALITMGEGWHNNHHYFQSSVKQGFYWWEVDMSYYLLKSLSKVGLVWDLKTPPASVLEKNRVQHGDPIPAFNPRLRALQQSAYEMAEAARAKAAELTAAYQERKLTMSERAHEAGENARQRAHDMGENARARAQELADATRAKAEELADAARSKANELGVSTRAAAQELSDRTRAAAEELTAALEQLTGEAQRSA